MRRTKCVTDLCGRISAAFSEKDWERLSHRVFTYIHATLSYNPLEQLDSQASRTFEVVVFYSGASSTCKV